MSQRIFARGHVPVVENTCAAESAPSFASHGCGVVSSPLDFRVEMVTHCQRTLALPGDFTLCKGGVATLAEWGFTPMVGRQQKDVGKEIHTKIRQKTKKGFSQEQCHGGL